MEDQLTAHLDRGWDLAQKGDSAGASACAKRALEIEPQSPEVHNLMGFAAALEGDADEALEHYRQAIALDETYFEAMLNAAEVMIAPLGDHDGAIVQIEEALDYAETDEEIADCILLKVDALMAKADYEEAKRAMKMLPDGPFNGPTYLFLIGRAWYELGQIDKAAPLIEHAAKADPQSADAQYYLGLVRDEQGDSRGATEALLRSRSLDSSAPRPPGRRARKRSRPSSAGSSRSSISSSPGTSGRRRCTWWTSPARSSWWTASTRVRSSSSTPRRPRRARLPACASSSTSATSSAPRGPSRAWTESSEPRSSAR